MPLGIVHYNEPILRRKGEKITTFDKALAKLADDMIDTMHAAHGIGLAAQQIGKAIQLCVVDLRDADADFAWQLDGAHPPLDLIMPMILVNPIVKIVPSCDETTYEEGCLSFPQIRGEVVRPDALTVKFQDQFGIPHEMACDGLLARCIQHEVDHLNGVLFIERMDKKTRELIDGAVKHLAKQTKEEKKDEPKKK